MKKIEAIIRPDKMEELQDALAAADRAQQMEQMGEEANQ